MPKQTLSKTLYDALKRLAQKKIRGRGPRQTLHATELVHEVCIRLMNKMEAGKKVAENRAQYFKAAAYAMRDILVEHARRRLALKRGGNLKRVDILDGMTLGPPDDEQTIQPEQLLSLRDALDRLEKSLPENAELVLLRFFAGLTNDEIARMSGVSRTTIERRWRFTRAWLKTRLYEPISM